ncbi:unnamed protein product [Urochloa humidicola]
MAVPLKVVRAEEGDGGFVRGDSAAPYLVMDDLRGMSPIMSTASYSYTTLLKTMGVTDIAALQEKAVELGTDEALEILRVALQSKTVLTDVFLAAAGVGVGGEKKRKAA